MRGPVVTAENSNYVLLSMVVRCLLGLNNGEVWATYEGLGEVRKVHAQHEMVHEHV